MLLVKILKRRDASSLIVAIILATIIGQALSFMAGPIAGSISGLGQAQDGFSFLPPESGWKQIYLFPAVSAVLQVVVLELLAWIVIGLEMAFKPSKKKK